MSEDEIGRAAHEAWKRWRIEGGYPDHAFVEWPESRVRAADQGACRHPGCRAIYPSHHEDMIDWDDLKPEKRQKYIVQGMVGYEARGAEVDTLKADLEIRHHNVEDLVNDRQRAVDLAKAAEADVAALTAQVAALKAVRRSLEIELGLADTFAISHELRGRLLSLISEVATEPAREAPPDA